LFDFLNQIKGCECCIHADASWCFLSAKGFKKAFRRCPNPSEIFSDFSGIYSHFFLSLFYFLMAEGPIQRTREGGSEREPIKILLRGDGNSNKMNMASNTRLRLTTQVGQAHVATGAPLNLGTNTQPSDPRTQRNTKPRVYRPTPVRLVSTTGQTGPCW
jgi:hypothetical protein